MSLNFTTRQHQLSGFFVFKATSMYQSMADYKKQLGLALNDMKQADWFKELDSNTQKDAIDQVKEYYTPPDAMENTLLNIAITAKEKLGDWNRIKKEVYPHLPEASEPMYVRLTKRLFYSNEILSEIY